MGEKLFALYEEAMKEYIETEDRYYQEKADKYIELIEVIEKRTINIINK